MSLTNSVLGILPIVALIEVLALGKEDSEQISYEPKYEALCTAGASGQGDKAEVEIAGVGGNLSTHLDIGHSLDCAMRQS